MLNNYAANSTSALVVYTGELKVVNGYSGEVFSRYTKEIYQTFSVIVDDKPIEDFFTKDLVLLNDTKGGRFSSRVNADLKEFLLQKDAVIGVVGDYIYKNDARNEVNALREDIKLQVKFIDDKVKVDLLHWKVVSDNFSFIITSSDYYTDSLYVNVDISGSLQSRFDFNFGREYSCIYVNKFLLDKIYNNIPNDVSDKFESYYEDLIETK